MGVQDTEDEENEVNMGLGLGFWGLRLTVC